MLLGEARSKCQHLAGTPLKPEVAEHFYEVTLIKGAWATTAIEGNTLSEEQVAGIRAGTFKAPPSREYQEREVQNVLDALGWLHRLVQAGEAPKLTSELLCEFNLRLLEGTEVDEDVVPGELRLKSVAVGPYLGAPAEECSLLLDKLCAWIEGTTFQSDDDELQFALALLAAAIAHLYIAWIHPFGDGNGRTARLVEFLILARSGAVPIPAAHLLSNHYMATRPRYYRELNKASQNGGDIRDFLAYAIQGFVDGIRDQIDQVRTQQFLVAWVNFVHETMSPLPNTGTTERQLALVLAMPVGWTSRRDVMDLSPKTARLYSGVGPRTLTRDLNRLESLGLVGLERSGREVRAVMPRIDRLAAFLPPMARPKPPSEVEPEDPQLGLFDDV